MQAKSELGSHISCFQECKRVRGNEPPHCQMSSHFGSWSLNGLLNFYKAISRVKTHWIEKFLISLERSWNVDIKMGSHDPFEYFKHKLWPKEGLGIKLSIWFPPLKVGNCPNFLACRWRVTYRWKAFNEEDNFTLGLTSIKGLHTTLWASKVVKVPILGILGFPSGGFGTKCHLGAGPVARHRVYYKGEGGGFPQIWAVVSLMGSCLPMARPCIESVQTTH